MHKSCLLQRPHSEIGEEEAEKHENNCHKHANTTSKDYYKALLMCGRSVKTAAYK